MYAIILFLVMGSRVETKYVATDDHYLTAQDSGAHTWQTRADAVRWLKTHPSAVGAVVPVP